MPSMTAILTALVDEVCETAIHDDRMPHHFMSKDFPDLPRIYLKPEDRKKLVEKYVRLLK